jgi:hypothetical protein
MHPMLTGAAAMGAGLIVAALWRSANAPRSPGEARGW